MDRLIIVDAEPRSALEQGEALTLIPDQPSLARVDDSRRNLEPLAAFCEDG